jgi:hypothetical protein
VLRQMGSTDGCLIGTPLWYIQRVFSGLSARNGTHPPGIHTVTG